MAALAAAGCGGSGAGGGAQTTTQQQPRPTAQERRGRQLFVTKCGPCHALAAAGTHGSAGPDLDEHPWRAVSVREDIDAGPGLMPAGLVSGADAGSVAAFVAAATRRG